MYYIQYRNNKNEYRKLPLDIYETKHKNDIHDRFDIEEIICIEDIPHEEDIIKAILIDILNIEKHII